MPEPKPHPFLTQPGKIAPRARRTFRDNLILQENLAHPTGFEPVTFAFGGPRLAASGRFDAFRIYCHNILFYIIIK
jgi:hypothetical protein